MGVLPLTARAQQRGPPRRIAVLMGTLETGQDAVGLRAVLIGLKTLGWTEGVTARIDVRWSNSDLGLMRENAQALLALLPDVILCHSNPALAQLRPVAGRTPIVFVMVGDPVGSGFVNNLAHPGDNITGFTNFQPSMGGKWVEMLKEISPQIAYVGVLMHPETNAHLAFWREAEAAAHALRVEPRAAGIHTAEEIEQAVAAVAAQRNGGLSCFLILSRRFTAISSSRSQRGSICPQCTPSAHIRWPAAWRPMALRLLITSDPRRITSTEYSEVPNRLTSLCKRRRNSNWSSILRPQRRLTSTCLSRSSHAPTR